MRDDVRRVRQYELMAIFSPEVPEEDLQGAIDRVGALVSQAGGTVTLINRESPWGRRRLAYPIRHDGRDVRDGIYVLYYLDLEAQGVAELERDLRLMDSLMRYLVTQQVAEPMIPESMKPAAEGDAEAAASGAAAEQAAPEDEAAPEGAGPEDEAVHEAAAPESIAEAAAAEDEAEVVASEGEVPAEEAADESGEPAAATAEPASVEAAEESPVEEAPVTDSTEETAAETGEDTGKQG